MLYILEKFALSFHLHLSSVNISCDQACCDSKAKFVIAWMSQNGSDNTDAVYHQSELIRLCLVTGTLSCLQLRFNVLLQEFNVIYRAMTLGE